MLPLFVNIENPYLASGSVDINRDEVGDGNKMIGLVPMTKLFRNVHLI